MSDVAEELFQAMLVRQRLLESASRELHDGFVSEAVRDLIDLLRFFQRQDERVIQLHAECHGLIAHCTKVLALAQDARPRTVILEPPSPPKET